MVVEGTRQVDFPFVGRRKVRAAFDAEPISSDGGLVLLSHVDRALGLVASVARQLPRWRDERYVEHDDDELLRQRIFQIAAGYEDCNDANTLRRDPVLKASCGRDPLDDGDLASQPTLSRLENAVGVKSCYRIAQALLESYVARHPKRPSRIVIDIDTTADPLHGQQELRFFNAHYNEYVYMPLLIFDQDGDLLTAVLQPGRPAGGGPVAAVLKRIIRRLHRAWPGIPILVRGDSGFASPAIYRRCRAEKADILLGFQPNKRLAAMSAKLAERARRRYLRTGQKARLFKAVRYKSKGSGERRWPRSYRMIIKAEHMEQGSNVRYVITNLSGNPETLYDRYVQRGESSENSIKDLKRALKADRLSCHRFWPNQFRLLLHATAYVLMYMLRRAARGTELAVAQMDTLRLRLLKVGAQVQSTARRVWLHLASSHPWSKLWLLVAHRLLGPRPFA